MPVGFNSPARNLFLLGSTGAQVITNFFKTIDQSTGTDGAYVPDEIKYNFVDQKFLLAGTAEDNSTTNFGWIEKRNTSGSLDYNVRIQSTQTGADTSLRALELDSNNNLIVVGKTGTVPWIAKYSNGGTINWQSTTNSADVEYTGVTSDSNGNYYACGNTPTQSFLLQPEIAQAFVEKFDVNGNPSWGKSAVMLGRDVVLRKIAANSQGEVVAVGYLEDDSSDKGYIVKINANTGEVLWDRTLSPDVSGGNLICSDVYIDSKDQIYVTVSDDNFGYLLKYTAEGNMIWQKRSNQSSGVISFDQVKSDGETEQTIVFGTYNDGVDTQGVLSKYSKNGSLVWSRTIFSSFVTVPSTVNNFKQPSLDADPSFYYFLYTDDGGSLFDGKPDRYTFGKVSSTGNGLGAFQYSEGTGRTIDYEIFNIGDVIGRLSDGSVRQDSSDLITYPFSANKLLFDDLATQVSNKKRQMDSADSFEYSGSPAIRPADFQELNLLGDVYSGSGNWLDQSGKGNDGVVNGATWNASGWFDFDGVDDYILSSDVFSYSINEPITISLWFRTNTLTNDGAFYRRILNFTNNHGIITSPTDVGWYTAGANLIAPTPISTGVWYNVEYVYTGSQHQIYLNGELKNTETSSNAAINSVLWVGRYYGSNDGRFDGDIGEVRIYPRALTPAQVFQNYNATKSKYINEAPDTAPKIGPGIVYDSNLLLNYDFGNRASYDRVENLLESSEEFDSNYWIIQQCIVEDVPDELSPVGLKGVKKVSVNAVGPTSVRLKNFTIVEGGFTYTASVYVKDAGAPAVTLFTDGTNSDPNYAGAGSYYNLSGPNAGQVSGSNADSAGMEYVGNGWWRCWFTDQYDSGGSWHPLTIVPQHTGAYVDVNSQTNANGKGCYIWGAQVEKSATLGRYIKTYGSAITAPTTVKNLSSTSYTGTINGATFNSAGYFTTGSNLWVSSGYGATGTSDMTIEQWVRASNFPVTFHATFYSQSSNASGFYGIGYGTTNGWFFGDYNGSVRNVASGGTAAINTWYHFVGRRSGGNLTVWINGTNVTVNSASTSISFTTADPRIGSNPAAPTGEYWNGDIAETRIYNRALTATEVSQNFNATRSKYGV